MRRFLVGLVGVACVFLSSSALAEEIFRGKRFERVDDGWFLLESSGRFRVDPETISVRFADGIDGLAGFRASWTAAGGDQELLRINAIRVNVLGIHDLSLLPGQDPLDLARRFEGTGLVRWAEPNTIGEWVATPNDPRYGDQWHLRNVGQTGGTTDADVDADEGWDQQAGDPSVAVAIVDSGTDIDHVDLVANLWKNAGETPGNNQDDDGNGFVDDYDGWNFEAGNGNPRSSNGHGTNVAGIVAARTDNGTGIAGIAGGFGAGNGARLMPLKVGTSAPNGAVLDDAILYAANNGARVITMSLTVGSSQAIDDALSYAYNTKGAFIDCASGNGYASSVSYPASNPHVMAVGATDHNDVRASFSNYGSQLELVAPGVSVLTTGLGNTYQTNSGTSFSAPCVAGGAALLFSKNGSLTNAQVRQYLKDGADDLGSAGFDVFTGYGRLNVKRALDLVGPAICTDADGDGFYATTGCGTAVDCNDGSSSIYPGAPEICRDGIDQDCDGVDKTKGKGCRK